MSESSEAEVNIGVSLPLDVLRDLKGLADLLQVSPSVALQYAITTTRYLQDEIQNKESIVLLKRKDNKLYEIEWDYPSKNKDIGGKNL